MTSETPGIGTSVLQQLSDGLADAVAKAAPSIVLVSARRRLPASGVAWSDGVIVTADHVIENEENITVGFADGREAQARLVGRDPGSDLAVLRVEGVTTPAIERGPAARVGHFVLALGRPAPGEPMASFGVVSAVGGAWRTFRGGQVEGYLRSDTTFYPGFSGGPLINTAGQMVGLNSSRLGRGAGLTIPIAALEPIVEALLSGGRIKRGYLGIGSQVARLQQSLAAKVGGQENGLLIVGVEPGSPADRGGLLVGDILVALGGSPLNDTDDLHNLLGPSSVGKATPVTLLRGGERQELEVTIGERQ